MIDLTSRSKKLDVGLVVARSETARPLCAWFALAHHLRRFQRDHLLSQKLDFLDCNIPLREANAYGPSRGFQLGTRILAARRKHHEACDGVDETRVRLQVKVTVEGGTLTADFTGSDAQVRGALNCTRSFTVSAVALCVRCALREDVPNTAGMFKPLNIIAPPGTVTNVVMPGASSMRGVTGFRLVDTLFGALAGILPDRIPAAGEGGNTLVVIGGQREDRSPYVYYELLSGTWGARPDRDGNDGLCNPANVASNIPIEQAESEYPVRINRYGLVKDSGGAGKFRGGLGLEREWTLLSGETHLAIRSDRRKHLPYGLYGGGEGAGSINLLHDGDGERRLPVMISTTMKEGQVLYHRQAGGGGWGDPLDRAPGAVARDVRNDKVGLQAAREQYGVVIDEETMEVDQEATAALRRRLRMQGDG